MSQSIPPPDGPVTADALEAVISNRRIRDKGGYIARWIAGRDLVRQDMRRIIALLKPLVAELSSEIEAHNGKQNSGMRRRMSHCSILLNTVVGASFWLGIQDRELLKESRKAVRLAREGEDHAAEIRALYNQGAILDRLGDTAEALDTHRSAILVGRRHGLSSLIISSLLGMAAILHFKLKDPAKALEVIDECTAIFAQDEHTGDWISTTIELRGLIVHKLGRLEESLKMMASACEIATQGGYPVIELRILSETIDILSSIGQYSSALEHARRIEELIHDIPQPARKEEVLRIIGRLLLKLNELEAARTRLEEAYQIAVELENHSRRSNAAHLLGRLYLASGNPESAQERLLEAIELAEDLKKPALLRSRMYSELGLAYAAQARDPEAVEAYCSALALGREKGYPTDIIESEYLLGTLSEALGRPDAAASHYEEVIAAGADLGSINDEEVVGASERLALLAAERHDFHAAFNYYRRHHELRRALDARHHSNQIMILRVRYHIDRLEEAAAQALDEKDRAHAALHSARTDIDAMKLALIEHQQRFKVLTSRLEHLIKRAGEEDDMETLGILRSIARQNTRHAGITHAQWQLNLSSTNEGFRKQLREKHPTLTPALELLCDCIRSGLTTDSIASVLHISPAAISKRRHRLRKVLGLRADQQLEKYLGEI